MFAAIRLRKSKRPKDRPKSLPYTIIGNDGITRTVEVPAKKVPRHWIAFVTPQSSGIIQGKERFAPPEGKQIFGRDLRAAVPSVHKARFDKITHRCLFSRPMGLSLTEVELLIRLKEAGHIGQRPSVIEIGAQQLGNTVLRGVPRVQALGRLFGVDFPPPLPEPLPTETIDGIESLSADAPLSRLLWTWLGFSYASVDIDGSPSSIPLDLNFDDVPPELVDKHDVVTNFGTTEHIANQLNAFKIIHDLTAPGGTMMHTLPVQGRFNQGLINYSPKFFWMLARSNEYRWLYFDFHPSITIDGLPENLVESVRPFRPEIVDIAQNFRVIKCSMIVALQKRNRAPYVPPIDLPTGMATNNEKLLARYWSVLKRR